MINFSNFNLYRLHKLKREKKYLGLVRAIGELIEKRGQFKEIKRYKREKCVDY